jgi:hypothetical protein
MILTKEIARQGDSVFKGICVKNHDVNSWKKRISRRDMEAKFKNNPFIVKNSSEIMIFEKNPSIITLFIFSKKNTFSIVKSLLSNIIFIVLYNMNIIV